MARILTGGLQITLRHGVPNFDDTLGNFQIGESAPYEQRWATIFGKSSRLALVVTFANVPAPNPIWALVANGNLPRPFLLADVRRVSSEESFRVARDARFLSMALCPSELG
jgi:hypothetical protein